MIPSLNSKGKKKQATQENLKEVNGRRKPANASGKRRELK